MIVQRSALAAARRAATTPIVKRSFTTSLIRNSTLPPTRLLPSPMSHLPSPDSVPIPEQPANTPTEDASPKASPPVEGKRPKPGDFVGAHKLKTFEGTLPYPHAIPSQALGEQKRKLTANQSQRNQRSRRSPRPWRPAWQSTHGLGSIDGVGASGDSGKE